MMKFCLTFSYRLPAEKLDPERDQFLPKKRNPFLYQGAEHEFFDPRYRATLATASAQLLERSLRATKRAIRKIF